MSNTKTTTLAIVAIFMAATLAVGTLSTVAATQPAFAALQKKPGQDDKKDNKTRDNGSGNGRNGNTITALKCQNNGSASGFDNTLDQECQNLICTHPGENATCSQQGARAASAAAGPVPGNLTCEQCFTKLLKPQQLNTFLAIFGPLSLEDFCTIVLRQGVNFRDLDTVLFESGVSQSVEDQLIQCLLNAGVHITDLP